MLLLDLALCAIAVKKGYFHPQSFGRASTGLHPLVPMGLCLLGNKKVFLSYLYVPIDNSILCNNLTRDPIFVALRRHGL